MKTILHTVIAVLLGSAWSIVNAEKLPDYLFTDLTQLCISDEVVDYALADHPEIKRWFREDGTSLCDEVIAAQPEPVTERDPQWRTMSPWTLRDLEEMMTQRSPEMFTGGRFAQECFINDFEGTDSLCSQKRLELHRRGVPMSQQQYDLLKLYCERRSDDIGVQRSCITEWIEQKWVAAGVRTIPRTTVGGLDFDEHVVQAGLLDEYRPKPRRVAFVQAPARTPAPARSVPTSARSTSTPVQSAPTPARSTPAPARPVATAPQPVTARKPAPSSRPAPASPPQGRYGAVALSNDFSNRYGFVLNKATADEARRAALAECGSNCYMQDNGVFTSCGALIRARHPTARGTFVYWNTADSRSSAESVIRECEWQREGYRCSVDVSGCN